MSIILKSKIEISRSPINDSVSKQMYSFPKAERFPKLSKNNGRTEQYYSLPNIHSIRYTTLGYGQRSDFTASQKGINSKFYGNYSDFDPHHPHGPKFSFANGREKYEKVFIEGSIPNDKNVPGPGKYFLPKPFGYDGIKFSMKGRNEEVKNNNKIKKTEFPGPGEYPITVKINEKGKYAVSNITNISSLKFGDKDKKRFVYNISKFPGPGKYELKPLFGKIFDSRYRSNSGITIGGRYKNIDSRSNYPGPGSYRLPSDFGQYLSKDADKYPSENVYPIKKYPFEEKAWRHGMKIKKDDISYHENEEIDDKINKIDNIDNNKDNSKNENIENNKVNNDEFYIEKEEQEDEKPGREVNNYENSENKKEEEHKDEIKKEKNEEGNIDKVESKPSENKNEEINKEEIKKEENEEVKKEDDKNEGEFVGFLEKEEQDDVKPKDMEQMNEVKNEQ